MKVTVQVFSGVLASHISHHCKETNQTIRADIFLLTMMKIGLIKIRMMIKMGMMIEIGTMMNTGILRIGTISSRPPCRLGLAPAWRSAFTTPTLFFLVALENTVISYMILISIH